MFVCYYIFMHLIRLFSYTLKFKDIGKDNCLKLNSNVGATSQCHSNTYVSSAIFILFDFMVILWNPLNHVVMMAAYS